VVKIHLQYHRSLSSHIWEIVFHPSPPGYDQRLMLTARDNVGMQKYVRPDVSALTLVMLNNLIKELRQCVCRFRLILWPIVGHQSNLHSSWLDPHLVMVKHHVLVNNLVA
jgi:hypothetical protein